MGHVVGLRHLPRVWNRILLLIVIAMALAMVFCTHQALAQDGPTLVVATENLAGAYKGAVILAAPIGPAHVGVILNRPTKITLAQLFPDHAPSVAVKDPIYLGGPANQTTVFAMVASDTSPGPGSFMLMAGVWLATTAETVDRLIETRPNDARFYAGVVTWRQGELAEEVRKGWMALRPADAAKLFLPDTSKLHEQLVPKKGEIQT